VGWTCFSVVIFGNWNWSHKILSALSSQREKWVTSVNCHVELFGMHRFEDDLEWGQISERIRNDACIHHGIDSINPCPKDQCLETSLALFAKMLAEQQLMLEVLQCICDTCSGEFSAYHLTAICSVSSEATPMFNSDITWFCSG